MVSIPHRGSFTILPSMTGKRSTTPPKPHRKCCWVQAKPVNLREFVSKGIRVKNVPRRSGPYLLKTSIPGVFAAGDTRSGAVKRVASGVGVGSVVVQFVHHYFAAIS